MTYKLPALAGAMIAAMAVLVPLGIAHNDNCTNGGITQYPDTRDLGNGAGWTCAGTLAVDDGGKPTGFYDGAAGPWFQVFDVPNPGDVTNTASGSALCDMEVLSNGAAAGSADDEIRVDGAAGGLGTTHGGLVGKGGPTATDDRGPGLVDAFWDDGGQGAVCHTPNTHYTWAPFNTQDCDFDNNNVGAYGPQGSAFAWDHVMYDDVWLLTTCDFLTDLVPGNPLLSAVNCVVNEVLTLTTNSPNVLVFTCVDDLVACMTGGLGLDADPCPAGPGGVACGPDGNVDSSNQGLTGTTAKTNNAPWTVASLGVGVPYPGYGACLDTDGVAAAFVFDYANSNGVVKPAVSGYIT